MRVKYIYINGFCMCMCCVRQQQKYSRYLLDNGVVLINMLFYFPHLKPCSRFVVKTFMTICLAAWTQKKDASEKFVCSGF